MPTFKAELYHVAKRDGTKEIMIRVIHERIPKRIGTDLFIVERLWDKSKSQVKSQHPEADDINDTVGELLKRCRAYWNECLRDGAPFNIDDLHARMLVGAGVKFKPWVVDHVAHLRNTDKGRNADNYQNMLSALEGMLGAKAESLYFHQINPAFLSKFEKYLLEKGNHINTVHSRLKFIRSAFRKARIDHDSVRKLPYPFDVFKLKTVETQKDPLTLKELQRLESVKLLPFTEVYDAWAVWLLEFYLQGMRVSDVLLRNDEEIVEQEVDGETLRLLPYTMYKTDIRTTCIVHDKAQTLIEYFKQRNQSGNGYWLPYIDAAKVERGVDRRSDAKDTRKTRSELLDLQVESATATINDLLQHKIKQLAGITKDLTTHVARRTYSEICDDMNINTSDIAKLLGHASEKTTKKHYLTKNKVNIAKLHELQQKVYGT